MLFPKKSKYKKVPKPCYTVSMSESKVNILINGTYGIKFLETGRVSTREIDSVVKTIKKKFKKLGVVGVNLFCDHSITAKPVEVRMGKGKGKHKEWICLVKKGKVGIELFVLDKKFSDRFILDLLLRVSKNFSLKTKVVKGIL